MLERRFFTTSVNRDAAAVTSQQQQTRNELAEIIIANVTGVEKAFDDGGDNNKSYEQRFG